MIIKILAALACAVAGYLLGSISTGVIVSKLYGGIDIRKHGSGNIGMTNVMRTLGWVPSFLTFAGDALKGVLGALVGKLIFGNIGLCIGGVFAVVGHNWPVFFKFKGGKGMSTSFGFLLMGDWRVALMLLLIQVFVLLLSGYMSLASIISSCALVILACTMNESYAFRAAAIILCALSMFAHRENIKRLKEGRENALDSKKITKISETMVKKLKNRKNIKTGGNKNE